MNRPPVKRTARNVGVGLVLGAIVVGTGIGVREQMQAPPEPVPLEAPAKALDATIMRDGFEGEGQGAPVPPDPCSGPLVKPAGFSAVPRTWAQCFTPRDGSPVPTYPNGLGFPVPIGANKGEYTLCAFDALPNTVTNMVFDSAQANPGQGYGTARPAYSMFLSISACPGDFRMLHPGCWRLTNEGTLITSTRGVASTSACPLEAGKRYYLLAAPVNPADGLVPGENTCREVDSSAHGCDVQARQTATQ